MAFLALVVFLVIFMDWQEVADTLLQYDREHPGKSFLNPFDTGEMNDFNLWYFMIFWFGEFFGGIWQGASGYLAAAKTPHEAKMAGLLGTWRMITQNLMLIVIPLVAFVVMNSAAPELVEIAGSVHQYIGGIGEEQIQKQMLVSVVLSKLLPIGLLGLFAAVMLAAMVSSDDTSMHSWGTIFIQDVVMPFRKKAFSPRAHLLLLRISIALVGVFAFCFSLLFKQTEHILLFMALTGSIYLGGSGAVMVGGLYTRWGTSLGAIMAMVVGGGISVGAILLQQFWPETVGFLLQYFPDWSYLELHREKFPINGQWVFFICMCSALICYTIFSFLTPKRRCFDLDRMLHRGAYTMAADTVEEQGVTSFWQRLTGITTEFSRGDRIIAWLTVGWTAVWMGIFFAGLIMTVTGVVNHQHWLDFWHIYLGVLFVLGCVTTVWFAIYGIKDMREMFQSLATMKRNTADDGMVVDGRNQGEYR